MLEESGCPKSSYTLAIKKVPDDMIAFKADAFPSPNRIFKNSKGECKRADFILIAHGDKANWIIFIEMKKGQAGPEAKIKQQLLGAHCLLSYCRAIGQSFWDKPKFLQEKDYQPRYVSIRYIGMPKKPTRNTLKSGQHDSPDRLLKIHAPKSSLYFHQLV